MKLGLQLYTVRDLTTTGKGLFECLWRAKEMGYEGAQFSAVGCMNGESPEVSASAARAMLDETGLQCCATHRPWERFRDHLDEEIEFHRDLGCTHAAIGMPPKDVQGGGQKEWEDFADALSAVSSALGRAGIRFGYHNHAFEFGRTFPGGRRPFELLVDRCDPSVFFILDTYWVAHAGMDVVELIRKLGGRLPVVHLKDKAVFGWEVDYAPVGEGNLDWDRILGAFGSAGSEWLVVEQDTCRRDVWECVGSSARFLSGKG